MSHKKLIQMTPEFQKALNLNKARVVCLIAIIAAVIGLNSVLLAKIANKIPGKARPKSKVRRLQRFFDELILDFKKVALLVLSIAKINPKEPMVLALDRTNWDRRENEINILTLSVCTGDTAIPLLCKDLRCKGNSNTDERAGIIGQFISFFGVPQVKCLVCDREFVGKDWFKWLQKRNIPFVCRLRSNFVVETNGKKQYIKDFFHQLSNGEFLNLGVYLVCGVKLHVCGLKTKKGDLMILGSHGTSGEDAANMYLKRWNIETGFSQLKTRGFRLEDTRLCGDGKMDLLFALLAISLAWCYSCGTMTENVVPIKLLKHGRKEQSVFRRGLDALCACLQGNGCFWSRLFRRMVAVFADALSFVASVFPACRLKSSFSRR